MMIVEETLPPSQGKWLFRDCWCSPPGLRGRWTSGTLSPRLLACWYFSWYIATNYKAVGWPLVGLLSRIVWAGRVAVLLLMNLCWTWTIYQTWLHQYFSKSWIHLEMLINLWHFKCWYWGLNSSEHGALMVHPSVVYWFICFQTWHCNCVTLFLLYPRNLVLTQEWWRLKRIPNHQKMY